MKTFFARSKLARHAAVLITAATAASAVHGQAQAPTARVIDDAALTAAPRDSATWLSYGRDYAETRFSPLEQIDADNVATLGLAWSYDTGALRGLEATPLVANGVLYATTSWSDVFALDARIGAQLWKWDARADRVRGARACCDVVNRGVALYDGKVYVGVVDGPLAALDAATGRPFALDARAPVPPVRGIERPRREPIADLRHAAPATIDAFERIVRQGAYAGLGMPQFDWLTDDDLTALRGYVLSRRAAMLAEPAR